MTPLLIQLVPFVVASCFLFFLIHSLIPLAKKIGLVDHPSDRKQHKGRIPLIGGIAIAVSFSLSMLLFPQSFGDLRLLFFCIGLITVVGVLDDHRELAPHMRVAAQFIAALVLVLAGDTTIVFIGDIFGISRPLGLSFLAIPFSIIAIIGIINAFNMIDGHDGLAGSVSVIGLLGLLLLSYFRATPSDQQYVLIMLLLAALVGVFLLFNLGLLGRNNQVFLGDAGSMLLGLVMVFLLIKFSQREVPIVSAAAAPWIVGIPFLDLFSIVTFRLLSRSSPFNGDRNHLHHSLRALGLGKFKTLFILLFAQIIFTMIGVFGTLLEWPDAILFWSLIPILSLAIFVQHKAQRVSASLHNSA